MPWYANLVHTHAGSCSAWEIYDEYCRDFERQRSEEAAKARAGGRKPATGTSSTSGGAAGGGGTPSFAPSHSFGGAACGSRPVSAVMAAATAAAAGASATDCSSSAVGGPAGRHNTAAGSQECLGLWAREPWMAERLAILDRMVNQVSYADVAMDFKYWEDASDAFRCGLVAFVSTEGKGCP